MDCSRLKTLILPRNVCNAIAMASIETYPNESTGGLFARVKRGSVAKVDFAIPYQCARRGKTWFWTQSSAKFAKLASGTLVKLGDWHSHTSDKDQPLYEYPSETDLENIKPGELELIIALAPHKARPGWKASKIHIVGHVAGFEFYIAAYVRGKGKFQDGELRHHKLLLKVEG